MEQNSQIINNIDEPVGFIILRHVNSITTNNYWIYCYECIRKYYPENNIIIIDDNSNKEYLTQHKLYKTTIINSEYPKRGELLPYIYYLRNNFFDIAVIIHDSVFINKYIDFNIEEYQIIWDFEHTWDQIEDETNIIKIFNDEKLYNFYNNKTLWTGCFGGMTIIRYDYLKSINNKYNLDLLLNKILSRHNRCSFERIIAVLLQINSNNKNNVLLGNIHKYCTWGIHFSQIEYNRHLPIIKVWSGR
jgi:hypothetical protein